MDRLTTPGAVIMALVLIAPLAAACGDERREPSGVTGPAREQLAFVSYRDGNAEIYVMNSDGAGRVRLTDDPATDYAPAWSPDGTRIAFTSHRDGNGEIYVMNADGSGVLRLTSDSAWEGVPSWAPDGNRIVFHGQGDRDGAWDIYMMNVDGSSPTRLTTKGGTSPSWSSTGRIAFVSTRDGNSEIYVMHDDGSDVVRLTNDPASDFAPAWSPDGTKIAFFSDRTGDVAMYVMNADGSDASLLYAGPYTGGWWDPSGVPSWSPDGSKIAFETGDCSMEGCYSLISLVNVDGTNSADLAAGAQPAWRPRVP